MHFKGISPSSSWRDAFFNDFATEIGDLYSLLCETGKQMRTGKITQNRASAMEKQFTRKSDCICEKTLTFKPAETLIHAEMIEVLAKALAAWFATLAVYKIED